MLKNIITLFQYKDLIVALVVRDLKARYKNSVLGYAWTWLDPLLTMCVFILIFGIVLNIKTEYFPIYLLSGLVPWMFFDRSINNCVGSISSNAWLINRIYFPREIFPLTLILGPAVNLLLSFIVIIPLILIYGLPLTPKILLLPAAFFLLFLLTMGVGLGFAYFSVYFRDMDYIVPFIVRLLFYLTPIFYVIEGRIPTNYLDLYMILNPLAVILSFFRSCLMGYPLPLLKYIITCSVICGLVFYGGYTIFKNFEDRMIKRI